jgi:hypothetical protein
MRRLAFLLALVLQVWPLPASAEYDRKLFCRDNADDVLVLLDITSPLDQRARELLNNGIQAIIDDLRPGEQLRFATLADEVTHSDVVLTGCVPWCPDGLLDQVFGACTEGLLRTENRRLRHEVEQTLGQKLIAAEELPYSEILRTLASTTMARRTGHHLDLFIFSDLIENSEFIPGKEFWSTPAPKLMARISESLLLPALSDTSVRAFGVGRGGSAPRKALTPERMKTLTAFWQAYFAAAGTTDVVLSELLITN